MSDDAFDVLFVCTANACRSAMAQHLTQHALEDQLGASAAHVRVASAGVRCYAGLPMHPLAVEALAAYGIDAEGFASTRLTADLVERADLVLTADRAHRDAVVAFAPAASRRTFTLREFALLVPHTRPAYDGNSPPVARLRRLVDDAADLRGLHPPARPADYDVADPIGRSPRAFAQCVATMTDAITTVVTALAAHLETPAR